MLKPCKARWHPRWLPQQWSQEEGNESCLPRPHHLADPQLHMALQGCTRGANWSEVQMGVSEMKDLM